MTERELNSSDFDKFSYKIKKKLTSWGMKNNNYKKIKITSDLFQYALNTNNFELAQKMSQRMNTFYMEKLNEIDDIKDELTDQEYLYACNLFKTLFGS